MTKYESLIRKSEELLEMAKSTKDVDLKAFYFNASKGFEIKAKNLKIKEGCK